MAEDSMLWTTSGAGDGASGGFTQAEWVDMLRYMFAGLSSTAQAVLDLSSGSDLLCSGTASPVAVSSGAALVYGFFYWNTASVNVAVPTPAIGTTGFRIVLRAGWAAQTVRIALLISSDGVGTAPAVTQTPGTTWEISLATGTITTGGVIALTDTRAFLHPAFRLDRSKIDGGTVERIPFNDSSGFLTDHAGLRADAANGRVKLQAASPGVWLDETDEATKGLFLVLTNGVLAFQRKATNFGAQEATPFEMDYVDGQMTIAPTSANPPLILGSNGQAQRVLGLAADPTSTLGLKRQGGSASAWGTAGSTNQTVPANTTRMQVGVKNAATPTPTVTFPVAFGNTPVVICTVLGSRIVLNITSVTASTFAVEMYDEFLGSPAAADFHWIAIGPE